MKNIEYDYIIVGGGTSGSVTAMKLVNSGAKVLIIEEGNLNTGNGNRKDCNILIPSPPNDS